MTFTGFDAQAVIRSVKRSTESKRTDCPWANPQWKAGQSFRIALCSFCSFIFYAWVSFIGCQSVNMTHFAPQNDVVNRSANTKTSIDLTGEGQVEEIS